MSSNKYHVPPVPPKPMMEKKYFYTILFIKSFMYNVKGQAIIFRRKSLESLTKLLNDFDETYLHSSYEHSYQTKRLSAGDVDFIVKYTDNLNAVVKLIDQNSYIVKYSWLPQPHPGPCQQIPVPEPIYPPVIPMPCPPPINVPPPPVVPAPEANVSNPLAKKVKVVDVNTEKGIVFVKDWDDVNNSYSSYFVRAIEVGEDSKNWNEGDIALLEGKTLHRENKTPVYRRVKIMDTDKISEDGTIGIADFNDGENPRVTSNTYYISLKSHCYGDKIPDWAKDDDALLIDNKYLVKIDVGASNGDGSPLPEDLQDEGDTTFDPNQNPTDDGGNGNGNGNNSHYPPFPPNSPPPPFFRPPCFNWHNPRCYNCSLTAAFPQNLEDGMTFTCSCNCNCCNPLSAAQTSDDGNGTTGGDTTSSNSGTDDGQSTETGSNSNSGDGTGNDNGSNSGTNDNTQQSDPDNG